jgi:hypothetical protein
MPDASSYEADDLFKKSYFEVSADDFKKLFID